MITKAQNNMNFLTTFCYHYGQLANITKAATVFEAETAEMNQWAKFYNIVCIAGGYKILMCAVILEQ